MRNPLSDVVVEIQPSGIRKFFDIVSEMKDAISLGVGEPDFDTPWHIREEGIYSLEKGRTFYTSNAGLKELKAEIAAYLARRFDLHYDYNHEIMVTVGGSEAIDLAIRAMINPGEEVLIPMPSYVSYLPCVQLAYGVPVVINLKEENEFRLTKEELLEHITDKTKLLIMPFPNNPTGAIMPRKDLEEIAKICVEKDIFVISDEIYAELSYYGERHVSIAEMPGMKERTVVINGFSKAFAMTGWRLGYLIGPEHVIEAAKKVHDFLTVGAAAPLQEAAVTGLKFGPEYYQWLKDLYTEKRDYLCGRLEQMGLSHTTPQGSYFVLVDISGFLEKPEFTGWTDLEFCEWMIKNYGVAAVPGSSFFKEPVNNYIRLHFSRGKETLEAAADRLEKMAKDYGFC